MRWSKSLTATRLAKAHLVPGITDASPWQAKSSTQGRRMGMEPQKALALLEAMLGWEAVGDEQGRPKSPHVQTHLEAVLGYERVPGMEMVKDAIDPRKGKLYTQSTDRVRKLLFHLHDAITSLTTLLPEKDGEQR
jgi:hypothetical protein